jgi:hypothetical protein
MVTKTKRKRSKPLAKWSLGAGTGRTSVRIRDDGSVSVYPPLPLHSKPTERPLGSFDELTIGGGLGGEPCVLHAEAMSDSQLSVSLGFALFAVWVRGDKVHVRLQEGVHDPKTGMIQPHGWKPKGRAKR